MTKPKKGEPRDSGYDGHVRRPKLSARQFRRLFEQLHRENDTDYCMGCGRKYWNGDSSSIGYNANRELIMVGECCLDLLISAIGISLYQAPDRVPPWLADDAAWFSAHPGRSFRLRISSPGEWGPKLIEPYTLVRQEEPGKRRRVCVAGVRDLLPTDPPDAVLWAMFDLLQEARQCGDNRIISADEIRQRSVQLAMRGSS